MTNDLDTDLAHAIHRERARFLPRFNAEFDKAFAERRAGRPRKRYSRKVEEMPMALVEAGDLTEQVALKGAVNAMRIATQEDAFGFDMRVRLVMREQPTEGPYENPWNSDFVCDALGSACRELWAKGDLWRPIMVRTVRALTVPLSALHRELNAFLQDRDILPVLRVRTRSTGAGARRRNRTAARCWASSSSNTKPRRPRRRRPHHPHHPLPMARPLPTSRARAPSTLPARARSTSTTRLRGGPLRSRRRPARGWRNGASPCLR